MKNSKKILAGLVLSTVLASGNHAFAETIYTTSQSGSAHYTDDIVINIPNPTSDWECALGGLGAVVISIDPGKTVTINIGGAKNDGKANVGIATKFGNITLGTVIVNSVDTGVMNQGGTIVLGDDCYIKTTGGAGPTDTTVGYGGNGFQIASDYGVAAYGQVGDRLTVIIEGDNNSGRGAGALQFQGYGGYRATGIVGNDAFLETKGNKVHGIWGYISDVTIGDRLTINTYENNSYGIYAGNASLINVGNDLKVTTNNEICHGIYAGNASLINVGNNLKVTTYADGSAGIVANGVGAEINVGTNSQITTYGKGVAYGAYASRGIVNFNGDITINVDLSKKQLAIAADYNGIVNADGKLLITGSIHAADDGIINLKMQDGSILTGASEEDNGNVNLRMKNSLWNVTGDSQVTEFVANNNTVDMTKDGRTYSTLKVADLSGAGSWFVLDTDLASEANSDRIIATNGETGGVHYISVADNSLTNGQTVIGPKTLLIATDESQNTTFVGKSVYLGGLWETIPTIENLDNGNWYLTMIESTIAPATESLIGNIESTYGLWRNVMTDDTLRKRLGDLRMGGEEVGGVWARTKVGSLSGNTYDSKYQMFQVGIDKRNGNKVYGFAIDHSNTSGDYASGSGDGSMTGLSLYMTKYKDSGAYSDLVLRGGKLRSGVNVRGEYPDSLDMDTFGYSASYEIGKTNTNENGWFTEPQAQLVFGHLNGGEYRTERNTYIDRSGVNSLVARLGFVAGRKIDKASDYYFKANVYHEFLGKEKMDLAAANGETMSYEGKNKDTWFEVGLGTNIKLSKEIYFYGDVLKTFGGDIKKKWQVNAGLRWAFGGPKPVAPLSVVPVVSVVAPKHEEFLDTIYFDFDIDTPRAGEQAKIDNFVKVAKENPDRTYSMVGHTDAIGTDEYNMELSKRRADNVKAIAKNAGVPATQMEESYQGKAKPADSNDNAEGRANNRRVNIFEYTNK